MTVSSDSSISFIILNHNHGRFLPACIESCLGECTEEDEVIVIDNGSDDDSRLHMEEYRQRVQLIFQENRGQAGGFRTGLAAASGSWIWFVDGDDLIHKGALRQVKDNFCKSVVLVYGHSSLINAAGNEFSCPRPEITLNGDCSSTWLTWGRSPLPPTSGLVYRRSFIDSIPPIPIHRFFRYADEYYNRRAAFRGEFACTDTRLFAWRIHGDNLSNLSVQGERALLQHYKQECMAYHYTKLEAARCGLQVATRRGILDAPHAYLSLVIHKSRGKSCMTQCLDCFRALVSDVRLPFWRKMTFLLLGVFSLILPRDGALAVCRMVFNYRLSRLTVRSNVGS